MAQRSSPNSVNILKAKRLAYRYAIFGDQFAIRDDKGVVALSTSSGKAEFGGAGKAGNDFMVTLGAWDHGPDGVRGTADDRPGGTLAQQAGTFMHELGHTLGLAHGGNDEGNYKPNYHSVMNYLWQVPFRAPPVATQAQLAFQTSWRLDYSREEFNILNEGALNEANGIGGHVGHVVMVGPRLDAAGNLIAADFVNEFGPVDWNEDGDMNDSNVQRDLNFIGDHNRDDKIDANDDSPGETFQPFIDWSHLVYRFSEGGFFSDGVHPGSQSLEMTLEDFVAFSDVTAPVSSLTIASPQYPVGAAQPFVTSATPFSISATDAGAGVHSVSHRVFLQGSTPPAFITTIGTSAQFTVAGRGWDVPGRDVRDRQRRQYRGDTSPACCPRQHRPGYHYRSTNGDGIRPWRDPDA